MTILKTGPWNLSDLKNVEKNGLKVLSCFSCGGGSTMGYKLAGYEVIGAVEIDPEMAAIYKANHHPKYLFNMPIQEFNKLPDKDIPEEFFNIDILDGSPPCSSFSMTGSREKKWGKKSYFREGQAEQHLDDLFFDFIATAKRLQPKVVIAENVKGLIQGNAKGYVKKIFQGFKDAGYSVQLFLLNAALMGVPQRRERIFFVANRLDKKIKFEFNEKPISVKESFIGLKEDFKTNLPLSARDLWSKVKIGSYFKEVHPKGSWFNHIKLNPNLPAPTAVSASKHYSWYSARYLNSIECSRIQSFPDDFNFLKTKPSYVCGMSVPPFMMQRIADQIYKQLF